MAKSKTSAWIYCFKTDTGAVFLNRWDEVIKDFSDYNQAEKFANENIHLVNKRLSCVIQ